MSEGEPKFELKKPREIKNANSFDELYEILKIKGEVQGVTDERIYKADELIGRIEESREKFRNTDMTINMQNLKEILYQFTHQITRGEGLRNKVEELLLRREK